MGLFPSILSMRPMRYHWGYQWALGGVLLWTHKLNIFHVSQFIAIISFLRLKLSHLWPKETIHVYPESFWYKPRSPWKLPCLEVCHDVPGSCHTFPIPGLDSMISPRSTVFFLWEMIFQDHSPGMLIITEWAVVSRSFCWLKLRWARRGKREGKNRKGRGERKEGRESISQVRFLNFINITSFSTPKRPISSS